MIVPLSRGVKQRKSRSYRETAIELKMRVLLKFLQLKHPVSSKSFLSLLWTALSLPFWNLASEEVEAKQVHMLNPQADKLVRKTTMVATAVASYFLLTADYGPEPNALDPVCFFQHYFYFSILFSLII